MTDYNGRSYTFTWENGRRLKTASVGSNTLSFTYNHDGIRTSKTVNGVVHNYTVSGSLILTEEWGTNLVVYLYDANGSPIGMRYRTSSMAEGVFYTFWFDKNLQGDVVAVYNETGTKVLSYTYDAWGNKTTTVHNSSGTNSYAQYNAITYRGYYFDSETSLYYVSSRYYDAKIGRFINADAIGLLGANEDFASLNLLAYCGNNPVSREDEGGEFWNVVIGAVVGAVVNAVTTAIDTYTTTGKVDWGQVAISAAVGGISGGVAATGLGAIAQAGITAGVSFVGSLASDGYEAYKTYKTTGERPTAKDVGKSLLCATGMAAIGFGGSLIGSGAGGAVSKGVQNKGATMLLQSKGTTYLTRAQAKNMEKQGKALINTARGISSVVGTVFTWPTTTALSLGL